jgi:radical SAM superfamily enzyme YgiQ (UPF0313 family)
MTYNFEKGIDIAKQIKNEFGNVPIIFGGYHVSGCTAQYVKWRTNNDNRIYLEDLENIFNTQCVDYIVYGEGERTVIELLECINNKKDITRVCGIGYIKNGTIYINERKRLNNLDSIPIPDREQLDWRLYKNYRSGETVATIHTLRGCRFNCSYCSTPATWGHHITKRSAKNIVDEIEYMTKNYLVNRISFADEDFFYSFERVHQICDEIINRKISIKWDSFACIEDILGDDSEKLLKNMKEAGCASFFVGIESLNMKTLSDYNRPLYSRYTIEDYLNKIQLAIDITSSAGISFYGDYIVGYPNECESEMIESFHNLKKLKNMFYVYLPILTAFPGTRLYEECKKNDWFIKGKTFKNFDCSQQVLKCCSEKVAELRDQLEIEYYTSPNYIRSFINKIKNEPKQLYFFINLYTTLINDYPNNINLTIIKDRLITNSRFINNMLETTFDDIIKAI